MTHNGKRRGQILSQPTLVEVTFGLDTPFWTFGLEEEEANPIVACHSKLDGLVLRGRQISWIRKLGGIHCPEANIWKEFSDRLEI
jgi:hypothetical protein